VSSFSPDFELQGQLFSFSFSFSSKLKTDASFVSSSISYRLLHIRVAQIFATQIQADLNLLQTSPSSPISLAAKWLPSAGSSLARDTLLPESVAVLLLPNLPPSTASSYLLSALQKTYLSPLRAASQIPERPLSAKKPNEVHYVRVPSLAMKRYKTTFLEKDKVRFQEYLVDVMKGKRSISGAALTPASLVAEARRLTAFEKESGIGDVLGAQWETLVESVRESGKMGEAMAVADVSGSMCEYSACGCVIFESHESSDFRSFPPFVASSVGPT